MNNTEVEVVIKRDGTEAKWDLAKWQAQIAKVCRGIANVSPSMIELNAKREFKNRMTTRELDNIALKSMVDLIDEIERPLEGNTNYQFVAGKQRVGMLRKDIFGQYEVPRLFDIVVKNVGLSMYTEDLLSWYTEAEWDEMESFMDHRKDEKLPFAAIQKLCDSYLVQNRVTGAIYESPQIRYIIAAATAFHAEKPDVRMAYVKQAYEYSSDGAYTLATPVIAGLGTRTKQFSSCVGIKTNDTMDSIFASGQIMAKYASKKAGIGFDSSIVRGLGAEIRKGEVKHMGHIPFLKKWFGDLRSASAGSIRNSASTVTYPIWHYEFEDLIVLKNNQGTEENRVRHLDYSVATCGFFWKRFTDQGVITFFDPHQVPDLYNAFYADQKEFARLYNHYETNHKELNIRIKQKPAEEVMVNMLLAERTGTGRIFILNVDNANNQGPFDPAIHPIYHSNLCFAGETLVSVSEHGGETSYQTISSLVGKRFMVNSARINEFKKWHNTVRHATAVSTGIREIVKLTFKNGDILVCTPDHPIADVTPGVWHEAKDTIGKKLHGSNGIKSVATIETLEPQECFDVMVLDGVSYDEHNFFVNIGKTELLVHNCQEIMLHSNGIGSIKKQKIRVKKSNVETFLENIPEKFTKFVKVEPSTPLPEYQKHTNKPNELFEYVENTTVDSKYNYYMVDENAGRVFLCTLGSINFGYAKTPQEMRGPIRMLQRTLHNLLQYQDFLTIESKLHNDEFEPLGMGVTNLAYWAAKRNLKYGEPKALAELKIWMEHMSFYATEGTVDLAEEKGACEMSHTTSYGKGIFIHEKRAEGVNELTDFTPCKDLQWEVLRPRMIKFGVRNTTNLALPPVESSSVVINSTNGFALPKALIIVKGGKTTVTQVVPEYHKLKDKYQLQWDQTDCLPYLKMMAVMQVYTDQGISSDTFYSPKHFADKKVPVTLVLKNLMLSHKWGLKSHYYSHIDKQALLDSLSAATRESQQLNSKLPVQAEMWDLPKFESNEDEEYCESCVL